jgi:Arm DNA-binding domain/Phage integrase, N-terminal SAM-like domain
LSFRTPRETHRHGDPECTPRRATEEAVRRRRLYLSVSTTGHKAWRFKYYFDGKEKHLQFGRYPEITLKAARDRRLEARRALEMGKDPGALQKAERAARSATFEALATEWLEIQRSNLTPKTFDNKRERFAAFVFPYLGKRPIPVICGAELVAPKRPLAAPAGELVDALFKAEAVKCTSFELGFERGATRVLRRFGASSMA